MEHNLNYAECLKASNHIGKTVYHNVCNGVEQIVPWGTADWALAIFLGGASGLMILFLLGLLASIAIDSLRY